MVDVNSRPPFDFASVMGNIRGQKNLSSHSSSKQRVPATSSK